ncbi:MAG: fused MFS/spermidine synthase [Candidatus Omnitrophica bacterium]|nr:fused MFS/spermidine synthase [Candidatus Omnitrophota bacterium]
MIADNIKNSKHKIIAFLLGFVSIISQIILMREIVSVFYGNELVYAVFLSGWLFWIALGSYLASCLISKIKNYYSILYFLFYSVCILLPGTMVLIRSIRSIIGIPAGEIIGIIPICLITFLIVAPITIVFGIIYSLICGYSASIQKEPDLTNSISKAYLWESLGSAIAGIMFSFVLIHLFSAMRSAFIVTVLCLFAILLMDEKKVKYLKVKMFIRISIIAILLFSNIVPAIDSLTRRIQWKGFDVVEVKDSIYGNIVITRSEEKISLFENGLHIFTTGDALTSEETVHYPLLSHSDPKNVLMIGNGLGGGLQELLKYRNVKVDYVELDPMVIEMTKRNVPNEDSKIIENKRVRIVNQDGRAFVKRSKGKYDVVIVAVGDPYTAVINRYYTFEFFKEIKKILNDGGILSLSATSSENYLNKETMEYLRSINTTLKQVFGEVKSIPGDSNIFLAGLNKNSVEIDPDILIERLKNRGIKTDYVREYYMPFKLSDLRLSYINNILDVNGDINSDMRSITYLNNIILYSTHFNTTFKNIFEKLRRIKFYYLGLIPLAVFLVGFLLSKKAATAPVSISIMTTGFSEILFQIIVIFAFQSLYGYAYYKIGFIISSFMLGLVLGVLVAEKFYKHDLKRLMIVYKRTQLLICFYPLVLPLVFMLFRDFIFAQRYVGLFATIFAALPIIAGFIGGLQYPLATRIVSIINNKRAENLASSAGILYAIDVLGASFGAFVAATFLIPVYGIIKVAIFCSMINFAVFLLLSCNEKLRENC